MDIRSREQNIGMSEIPSMRLDKWLWCARFYKTRSLAVEEIGRGRVTVNGANAKASREIRVGDSIQLRQGNVPKEVIVRPNQRPAWPPCIPAARPSATGARSTACARTAAGATAGAPP